MSSTTHKPRRILSHHGAPAALRSRSRIASEATGVGKGKDMGMREQVAGYIGLAGFSGVTQIAGVNFFDLAPDHRAWWIAGAVLVLWLVTCRGWHSR